MIDTWQLTKFDVAERQLLQAIRLFFSGGDAVSVHTLSEAAAQVLYDTRDNHGGVTSIFRDSDRIRPERKKEWLQHLFCSRNFFKHANKDPNATHEFKLSFNHFSLLDAVNMYAAAKKSWTPETLIFFSWFSLSYPGILKDDNPMLISLINSNLSGDDPIDISNFEAWSTCIDDLRSGQRWLASVTLNMGLPNDG